MRSLYLAAILSLVALLSVPALAQQQPDPAQALADEWRTVVASDTLTAASHKHTGDMAQKLVAEYQRQRDELAEAKKRAADLDAYLKACADKPGCTVPAAE